MGHYVNKRAYTDSRYGDYFDTELRKHFNLEQVYVKSLSDDWKESNVNKLAMAKAIGSTLGLAIVLILFVLGNIFFAHTLWVCIGLGVAVAATLAALGGITSLFYNGYNNRA